MERARAELPTSETPYALSSKAWNTESTLRHALDSSQYRDCRIRYISGRGFESRWSLQATLPMFEEGTLKNQECRPSQQLPMLYCQHLRHSLAGLLPQHCHWDLCHAGGVFRYRRHLSGDLSTWKAWMKMARCAEIRGPQMRTGLPSRKRTGKTGIVEFRAKSSLRFIQVEIKPTMWASSLFTPTGSCQNRCHPDLVLPHSVTKGAGTRETSYHSASAPSLALQAPSFLLLIASESKIQIEFLKPGLRPAPITLIPRPLFFFFLHPPSLILFSPFTLSRHLLSPLSRLCSSIARHLLASHSFVAVICSATIPVFLFRRSGSSRFTSSIVNNVVPRGRDAWQRVSWCPDGHRLVDVGGSGASQRPEYNMYDGPFNRPVRSSSHGH